ncbi:MAG: glucose dehydrogenase [Caldilineae bacterium]|nr:MAG: glucose dehydrogenase [Caldilineae bacterium]
MSPSPDLQSPISPSPNLQLPPIALRPFANGFDEPVYLTHAGDGTGRLFVVERRGTIRVLEEGEVQPEPFLDIRPLVGSKGREQGLLSVAFHPDFAANGRLFVNYTDTNGDTVIAEYRARPGGSRADPATARVLLTLSQPYSNHNGGQLQFGPDGNLYIGTGDGGAANDPHGNGQNPSALLGKMLRLNVDFGEPYTVPADNPFVDAPGFRPEIWAVGLRNPWRFSFDRQTGDLYIADVGQNLYEEVDFVAAGSPGGLNFGWNLMEGRHCFQAEACRTEGLTLPIAEYGHEDGCSITGGYVYRGEAYPALDGVYLYADFCSGKVWGLRPGGENRLLLQTSLNISSFGEDETGEVYAVDLGGGIYRVVPPE